MSEIYKVIARFGDASGQPIVGAEYTVGLRDKDSLFDDKLGTSSLNAEGEAEFVFGAADMLSVDSVAERKPDLYFIVWKNGEEIFRSETFSDVNFLKLDPVTGRQDSRTQAFGPFRIGAR